MVLIRFGRQTKVTCILNSVGPGGRGVLEGLDTLTEKGVILFLDETKEPVDVTEKLLVVVIPEPVMVVVTTRAGSEPKRNDILWRPGKVESAMQLGEKEGDDAIVDRPSDRVALEGVEGNNGEADLEDFFHK